MVGAVLALPLPAWALGLALEDGEWAWAAISACTAAAVVAAPLAAGRRRFAWLAGAMWSLLLALGLLWALVGGLVLWPAAFVFLVAALPRREATWPLARVLAVTGGVAAVSALALGVAAVVQDARDDPDLSVRLRPGASGDAFADRVLADPHVTSVGGTVPPSAIDVELVQGLTPDMRERLVAKWRRDPEVASVRVDD